MYELKYMHTKRSQCPLYHALENNWSFFVHYIKGIGVDTLEVSGIFVHSAFFLQMLMNVRRFLGYAREETASIQWALLNANALLVTSRVKLLRSVKVSVCTFRDMSTDDSESQKVITSFWILKDLIIITILYFNVSMKA